jgi:hypothetical protein
MGCEATIYNDSVCLLIFIKAYSPKLAWPSPETPCQNPGKVQINHSGADFFFRRKDWRWAPRRGCAKSAGNVV